MKQPKYQIGDVVEITTRFVVEGIKIGNENQFQYYLTNDNRTVYPIDEDMLIETEKPSK